MPSLTHRACGHPGCALTTPHSHRRPDERKSAAARGYGTHHRRWRLLILHRDPICKLCGQAPATEADHIVPLSAGGGWSIDNGQGLCKPCHSKKTFSEQL